MLLVLKEMKMWIDYLVGPEGISVEEKNSSDWQYFKQWLTNRKKLFEDDALSEYLLPIHKATLQLVMLKYGRDQGYLGNDDSFLGKVGSLLGGGALLAAAHEVTKQRKMLKGMIDIYAKDLRDELANNNIDYVFSTLQKDAENCSSNQITNSFYAIKKRHSDLKSQQMRGTISFENHTLEMNRINNSILNFISSLAP